MTTFSSSKCGAKNPQDVLKAMMSGNILFLDFDGVCNSFNKGSYLTHEPDDYGMDMDIIKRRDPYQKPHFSVSSVVELI